jgi:chemotaxis protein methyltransferase CheR
MSALLSRFGLAPRDGWQASIERATQQMAQSDNISADTLLLRAVTDITLLKRIAGHVTIPESFFFRHPEQLELIARFINEQLQDTPADSNVKIWSAGCSAGEEPLSLAILLKESIFPKKLERVSIIANDINENTIETAKIGRFTPWSFRGLSNNRRQMYFTQATDGRFLLTECIRRMVSFYYRSIQEQLTLLSSASIDVVLFRNVGIYLSSECLDRLYAGFSSVLKPGGLLCISPSDPMTENSVLEKIDTDLGVIYKKTSPCPQPETHVVPIFKVPDINNSLSV